MKKNNFIKNALTAIAMLMLIFTFALDVNAQSEGGSNDSTEFESASLYVTDVKLEKDSYAPGDTAQGSFTIHNINDFDVNGAQFKVSYISEYGEGHVPYIVDDTTDFYPLPFLKSNSKQEVNFSYEIPLTASGVNPGINVMSFLPSGLSRGWEDVDINLSEKGLPILYIEKLSIAVNGEDFAINTGPTIRAEDSANFIATFKNISDEVIEVAPHLVIRNQFTNKIISEKSFDLLSVNGKSSVEFVEAVDINDLDPAVYLAELEMRDSNGVNRIPDVSFRYIVGGEIGNIHAVYTDVQAVAKGDVLPVKISITGTPIDITRFEGEGSPENSSIEVTVYNTENSEKIGSATENISALINQDINVDVKTDKASDDFTINVKLFGSKGQLLDEYNNNIPQGNYVEPEKTQTSIMYLVLALIIVIIIFVIVRRKRSGLGGGSDNIAAATIVALLLVGGSLLVTDNVSVYATNNAFSVYSGGESGRYNDSNPDKVIISYTPTGIVVNSPKPPSVQEYSAGETFNFQVSFYAAACQNGPQEVYLHSRGLNDWYNGIDSSRKSINGALDDNNATWWSYNGLGVQSFSQSGNESNHNDATKSFQSSGKSGYVVPTESGTYDFYFYLRNVSRWSDGDVKFGWALTRAEVAVVGDQCTNIDGIQEDVPAGMERNSSGECYEELSVSCGLESGAYNVDEQFTLKADVYQSGVNDHEFTWEPINDPDYEDVNDDEYTAMYSTTGAKSIKVTANSPSTGFSEEDTCSFTVTDPNAPGVCGSSDGSVTSWPDESAISLCSTGSASPTSLQYDASVNGDGNVSGGWAWTCNSLGNGDPADCEAYHNGELDVIVESGKELTRAEEENKCLLQWDLVGAGEQEYSCRIISSTGSETATTTDFESRVEGGVSYVIECTVGAQTVESEPVECAKNPFINEQ
jgi:hypothetical protein